MSAVLSNFYYLDHKDFIKLRAASVAMMIRSSFILMLLIFVVCSFCGKDFVTLGRHSWRCKQRVHHAEQNNSAENTASRTPVMNSPNVVISSRNVIKCCCGKICKGPRGLKMHQRSCQVVHGLNAELYADIEEQINHDTENIAEMDQSGGDETFTVNNHDIPTSKKGIKLPKSNLQWSTANDYFNFALQIDQPITSQNLDTNIRLLNNIIYEYFSHNFGYADSTSDNSLVTKYKEHTVKALKKALKTLNINSERDEIKYVSHLLRSNLRLNNNSNELNKSDSDDSLSNSQ